MVRDFVRGNSRLSPPGYRGTGGSVRGALEGVAIASRSAWELVALSQS